MTRTAPQSAHEKRRLHDAALSSLRSRLRIGTALAGVVMPLTMPGVALAADECGGVPLGGIVTCTAAGNPYASGIAYAAGGQNLTFVLTADGLVHTTAPGIGISVSGAGSLLTLDLQGRVVTDAAGTTAVWVGADATNTIVNVNSITSAGTGLNVVGDSSISVTAGTIESVDEGIVALTYDGPISVDAHSITTTGDHAWGIDAFSAGFGTVTISGVGHIETRGNASHGIGASTGGDVDIDVNSVATLGADSHAIYAHSTDAGFVDIDVASVATQGARSNGVLTSTGGGDIDVTVGDASTVGDDATAIRASSSWGNVGVTTTGRVSTTGGTSHGVRASSTNGTVSATNSGTMTTAGDDSAGIFVEGTAGALSATNSGSVGTSGDRSIAIFATSSQGGVTVGNSGIIATTGNDSHGIMATSPDGAVTVTNGGTVTTTGDDAVAIAAESATKDVRVTNTGTLRTTGASAEAIWAKTDQGDIVIGNSGTISTTGAGSTAISANADAGDITVTSTGNVTTADGVAVLAQSNLGNVVIDVVSATAGGVGGNAINGFSTVGNVNARVGSASTTGEGYVIDLRSVNGDLTLVADTVTSQAGFATGVFAASDTGGIDLKVNSIVTQGEESRGISAETTSGPIAIDVGSVATGGDLADAILATSATGAVTVNAHGTISTTGRNSDGVSVTTDGDVDITVNDINTIGRGSDGITANSGSGNLTVVANGTITTEGKSAKGIRASSDSGDVDVTAGNIDTARDDAHGIEAYSTSGKVKIVNTGTIAVRGENAHGIVASGGAATTVIADSVSVSGYRADGIVISDTAEIDLRVRNLEVTGDGSDGIIAEITSGPVQIDVGNVYVRDGRAISAETRNGDTAVRIAGKVRGQAEEIVYAGSTGDTRIDILAGGEVSSISGTSTAIFATGTNVLIDNAGLISATSVPTLITGGGGATRLNNSGTFIGRWFFDLGDDLITNSGTFKLSGTSGFSDGNDLFVNTGTVSLLASASLQDLERFENSSLVTMANNRAGDVLTLSGDYAGTNGRLVLDIGANSGGVTHDQLVIGGTATGTTTIALNSLRGGAMLPGRTLTLVDAAGGSAASAFVLAPETVNGGFAHYAINYDGLADDFYISASEGLGLFQMLKVNEGAQALWRQSADAWSARTASLRDPAKDAEEQGRLWAQFYSSADERDQTYSASAGDFDISYRQKHVGGQVGADLGTLGGVTYGVTGGYLASALKFAGTNDRTDYDALNLGAYAQGHWGNYFVNGLAKYDLFEAKIDSVTGGFTEKLDGGAYGLQLEAGARFGNEGFFLEPVASLAYSHTDLDTLAAAGATVDFDAANSLRGKIGARIGGATPVGAGIATFYLGAHLVNEFEGKDGVRFDTGTSTSVLANDPVDAYGQFQLGATLVSEAGLNGFVEGTASVGNDYQNYGGRMGVRLAF
ncbi:autotransporter domain-containing protein [Mesorhizobium sp. ANAO-SY3R2]|uniref:autotransporter domain-containing protein n=1 Tax=Mesorhizobium sp. ANAO-SY3R2 TaxID=3166644 RepID=UPI00366B94DE